MLKSEGGIVGAGTMQRKAIFFGSLQWHVGAFLPQVTPVLRRERKISREMKVSFTDNICTTVQGTGYNQKCELRLIKITTCFFIICCIAKDLIIPRI